MGRPGRRLDQIHDAEGIWDNDLVLISDLVFAKIDVAGMMTPMTMTRSLADPTRLSSCLSPLPQPPCRLWRPRDDEIQQQLERYEKGPSRLLPWDALPNNVRPMVQRQVDVIPTGRSLHPYFSTPQWAQLCRLLARSHFP